MKYLVGLYNFPLRWEVGADNEEEAQRKGWEEIERDMEPSSCIAGGHIIVMEDLTV